MGAMLITGLVVSSVPVLAFAEQGKEEIAAEVSENQEIQEKDTQTDSDTNEVNNSETEIKTDVVSEEEKKEIVTENPEEKEKDVEDDTEKNEGIDTGSGNDADQEHGSENETGTETEPDSEIDSDTEEKSETEDKAPEEKNDASQDDGIGKTEKVDSEKSPEESPDEGLPEEKPEETEQLEPEILPEDLPETIPEELLPEVELATPSNLPMPKEESIDEQLLGTWAADEYTSLRFDEDGQGSMLLPESEYEFRYVLEDNKLTLDFASSRAKDAEYTVSIDEDSMKLTGGEEAMVQEIILQRTE